MDSYVLKRTDVIGVEADVDSRPGVLHIPPNVAVVYWSEEESASEVSQQGDVDGVLTIPPDIPNSVHEVVHQDMDPDMDPDSTLSQAGSAIVERLKRLADEEDEEANRADDEAGDSPDDSDDDSDDEKKVCEENPPAPTGVGFFQNGASPQKAKELVKGSGCCCVM